MKIRSAIILIALLAVSTATTSAKEIRPDKKIEALVEELGAADFKIRKAAEEALKKLSAADIPFLKTFKDADDPEIRTRLYRILEHLGDLPREEGQIIRKKSGLAYIELVEGSGEAIVAGSRVFAHFTGRLEDGTKFDSSRDRGAPFTFTAGQGHVIKGWEEGILDMKVGGRRKLFIPPELGYGAKGVEGKIPPNAAIIFEIEVIDANQP